jgi:hypothetical protein
MAVPPITGRAGTLCITAAVLIILSQVMRLAGGGLLGPDWLTTPAYSLTYTVALLGMAALPLALTAIYTRISPPAYPDRAQPPGRPRAPIQLSSDAVMRPSRPSRQRSPRLRLGPGQGHLGNPEPADSTSQCRWAPSNAATVPTEPRHRLRRSDVHHHLHTVPHF